MAELPEVTTTERTLPSTAFAADDAVARIGLVMLSTDATSEADFARLVAGEAVRVHANRITFENPTTPESLAATGRHLTAATADLLPASRFEAIYFACTSASAVLGEAGVAAAIRAAKPATAVVTPTSAAVAALRALGARRIDVLAPYSLEVTARVTATLAASGLEIDRVTAWGLADDRQMGRVRREVIVEQAVEAIGPAADALFISCTALRAAEVAAAIEARIGRPVVTSNQAAAWVCRAHAGTAGSLPAAGRLFARPFLAG